MNPMSKKGSGSLYLCNYHGESKSLWVVQKHQLSWDEDGPWGLGWEEPHLFFSPFCAEKCGLSCSLGSSGSGGKIIGRSVQNAGCPFWRGNTKHGHTGDLEVGWLRARWAFPPLRALSRGLCQTWKLTHVDAFGEMLEFVLQCEITCRMFLPVY